MNVPSSEVWVWLPRDREGALQPTAFELLYEAGALARRLGGRLVALSDCAPGRGEAAALAPWGIAELRHLPSPMAAHPLCRGGGDPLAPLSRGVSPRAVLFPDDSAGKVLAPLWAAANGAMLVPGATSVTAQGGRIVVARPALGDRYETLVEAPAAGPLAVTLLAGAVGDVRPPPRAAGSPALTIVPAAAASGVARVGEAPTILPPDPKTLDLADAERIVAFGRGAFSDEAIVLVRRLADLLGATVAGSRPAADEGWLPFSRQVGLTGAIVRPKLYVAVGISGAPYHMVGIKDPETLIAINRDAGAPIFGSATLGIVGDLYRILPALIARLERYDAPAAIQAHAPAAGAGRARP